MTDDEFEALSGWTTLGTLDAADVSDAGAWSFRQSVPTTGRQIGWYVLADGRRVPAYDAGPDELEETT